MRRSRPLNMDRGVETQEASDVYEASLTYIDFNNMVVCLGGGMGAGGLLTVLHGLFIDILTDI